MTEVVSLIQWVTHTEACLACHASVCVVPVYAAYQAQQTDGPHTQMQLAYYLAQQASKLCHAAVQGRHGGLSHHAQIGILVGMKVIELILSGLKASSSIPILLLKQRHNRWHILQISADIELLITFNQLEQAA